MFSCAQVGVYMPPAHMSTQHDRELCELSRDKYDKEVKDSGGQDVMNSIGSSAPGTRCGLCEMCSFKSMQGQAGQEGGNGDQAL
eukprot:scaffold95861_cov21-Tisochrysis_lutea.AAC.1